MLNCPWEGDVQDAKSFLPPMAPTWSVIDPILWMAAKVFNPINYFGVFTIQFWLLRVLFYNWLNFRYDLLAQMLFSVSLTFMQRFEFRISFCWGFFFPPLTQINIQVPSHVLLPSALTTLSGRHVPVYRWDWDWCHTAGGGCTEVNTLSSDCKSSALFSAPSLPEFIWPRIIF